MNESRMRQGRIPREARISLPLTLLDRLDKASPVCMYDGFFYLCSPYFHHFSLL